MCTMKRSKARTKAENVERLRAVVRRFRILREWRVRWGRKGYLYGQAEIDIKGRRARVYPWDPKATEPEPPDYLLHEVLHCAISEILGMDKRKLKELRQAEELLIRDICAAALCMPEKGYALSQATKNGKEPR